MAFGDSGIHSDAAKKGAPGWGASTTTTVNGQTVIHSTQMTDEQVLGPLETTKPEGDDR